ncbi:MAG: FtsX-like permease family protein, partial [Nanoarchaeota archaeon]|nr:FtsX-like permease family protein [Nanoarchaeota archaeon]
SFVSGIALLVGGINVMNTMYSNVLERVQEISAMKALGATNGDILTIFLVESSILGFFGALIGFIGAFGLAKGLSYLITNFAGYNVPINFSLNMFLAILLITTFFAMLFGTYPAWRGAKVNPADNLRDE